MADLLTTMTEVPVAEIETGTRLRPVSEAGVAALIASIGELGVMKDAIHVRKVKHKDGKLVLMAGAHRLEAARRLGWTVIPAKVWTCSDDWAQLMEIDDNLAGAELCPLDTAIFLARRKEVYERLHPETRAAIGAELIAKRWNTADIVSVVSFAAATAEKFGMSDRHVRRMIAAGVRLDPRDTALLRKAPRPVTLKDLMEIGKIGSVPERYHVVEALADGTVKTAAEARRSYALNGRSLPEKDPVEAAFKTLRDTWSRAPKAARRRFIAAHEAEVEDMLLEHREGGE